MKNQNLLKSAFIILMSTALFSACGSNGITGENILSQEETGSPVVDDSGTSTGWLAPLEDGFSLHGPNEVFTTSKIDTDNLLNLRVIALQAGTNAGSGNVYERLYNCAVYEVTLEIAYRLSHDPDSSLVWSKVATLETPTLAVSNDQAANPSDPCPGAVSAKEYSLSNFLSSGHEGIRFKVRALKTDALYQYCARNQNLSSCRDVLQVRMRAPLNTHNIKGNLFTQTNWTTF